MATKGASSPLAASADTCRAILLIGPTGSGKSPLGDWLDRAGLHGRHCVHFDFGRELRRVANLPRPPTGMSQSELRYVRRVLESGALLDDRHVHIAEKVFRSFVARSAVQRRRAHRSPSDPIVVLDGLPRRLGQARAMAAMVDVVLVVRLLCPLRIALARIRTNAGGDRGGRTDDAPESLRERHRLFRAQTLPLVGYYRRQGVPVWSFRVTARTAPNEIWRELCRVRF